MALVYINCSLKYYIIIRFVSYTNLHMRIVLWEGIIAGKNITTHVLKTFKPKLYLGSNKLLTYNCKFRN